MFSDLLNNIQHIKHRAIDQRHATIRRLRDLYSDGGMNEVYRGIRDYYVYNVSDSTYHDSRIDNDYRWSLIEEHLDPTYESLIDIGCADGFFLGKASDFGLTVLGLEHNNNRVRQTRDRFENDSNVEVRQMTISPDNISELEYCDVILFLTVHHHWVWQYGWAPAAKMFETVCDRANLVTYEPPGDKALVEDTDLDPAESIDYYSEVIDDLFGESVSIESVDMVPYSGGNRSDPLFILDSSAFDAPHDV